MKEVGALLKSYQEEIDRLTVRAKHGESAFLDVYQKLYEAPDPAAALIAALVRPPVRVLFSSTLNLNRTNSNPSIQVPVLGLQPARASQGFRASGVRV